MSKPYKTVEVYSYTETVYYDEQGNEVDRERSYDDWWVDTRAGHEDLTDGEMEVYFPYLIE